MRLEQKTITTIVADEGKLLVRKSDGWVAGERVTLGYNYYEAGVALSEPRLSKPEDYEEISKPENYEEKPIINHERRMARMAQLIEEEKRLFNQRGLSPKEMIKHKGFAPKWGNDVKEGSEVRRGDKFVFDGKLFAVLFIIMTIVSIALLIRNAIAYDNGYIAACKDIADGRCQAKVEN